MAAILPDRLEYGTLVVESFVPTNSLSR